MTWRELGIGRWDVLFAFAGRHYDDIEEVTEILEEWDATPYILQRVERIMSDDRMDTGFTFTVPEERLALVVTGPSSSGAEFIATFVHEVHHLAVAIAKGLGYDLDSEGPAYLAGDAARAFADVVCQLGCDRCHPSDFVSFETD